MSEKNLSSNQLFKSDRDVDIEIFTIWHNREDFVKPSLDSVLEQTASNFSLIAVDDGSTDSTGNKLEETLEKATEVGVPMLVWRKPNEGFTTSLKRAIEEIGNADVIAIHGAGDISLPRRIDKQYNLLSRDEEIVATGSSVELIDEEGSVIKRRNIEKHPSCDPFIGQVPRLGTHGAAMYYRNEYMKVGGYRIPLKYSQDTDLLLRLSELGEFRNVPEILYQKLVSPDTIASNKDWRKRYEQVICSAVAMESARCRQRGEQDPLEGMTDFDVHAMRNIATINGRHQRYVRRSSKFAWIFARSGDFMAGIAFLRLAGWQTIRYIPEFLTSIIAKHFNHSNCDER